MSLPYCCITSSRECDFPDFGFPLPVTFIKQLLPYSLGHINARPSYTVPHHCLQHHIPSSTFLIVMSSDIPEPDKDLKDQAEHQLIETSLEVEQLDTNLFRSKRLFVPVRARGVFGGQVISQAIVSATNCVEQAYGLHVRHPSI